jgi:hypothetical protein
MSAKTTTRGNTILITVLLSDRPARRPTAPRATPGWARARPSWAPRERTLTLSSTKTLLNKCLVQANQAVNALSESAADSDA